MTLKGMTTNKSTINNIYTRDVKILASDVDRYQHLRMSRIFQLLQELSIAHTEALGYPRETTLDKGMLWVISRMKVELDRPISYDEHIRLTSAPEKMLHMIYPRRYRILDSDGKVIGRAVALWMLIDAKNRRFCMPGTTHVIIDGPDKPENETYPEGLKSFTPTRETTRRVTYSELDLNGHVNNTRYLNWIDDLLPDEVHKKGSIQSIQLNFQKEIQADTEVRLMDRIDNGKFSVEGLLPDGSISFQAEGSLFS